MVWFILFALVILFILKPAKTWQFILVFILWTIGFNLVFLFGMGG